MILYYALTIAGLLMGITAWIVETVLFMVMNHGYYRLGPTLHREEWQTSVSETQALHALKQAFYEKKLVVSLVGDCILFRRRWWDFGAWPRGTLSVISGSRGAGL